MSASSPSSPAPKGAPQRGAGNCAGEPTEPAGSDSASGNAPSPPPPCRVGVLREDHAGERRVALVPDVVGPLLRAGFECLVEAGAGLSARLPDEAYAEAGALVLPRDEVLARANVLAVVGRPPEPVMTGLRPGQVLVGLLELTADRDAAEDLAAREVTALSLEGIPRTLGRAQAMDALTSQANVTGYRAVLVAAATYGGWFPLLITAAGTAKPARVLILGGGVAGLQAAGTAKRLGALVSVYDVRPAARGDVESVGAEFLTPSALSGGDGAGSGGYARALTPDEQRGQQEELNAHVARADVVITTARVPGRRPPLLVTAEAVKRMRPGSVVVDTAVGPLGGNVEAARDGETVETDEGITVIGAGALPAAMAPAASAAYARNIAALLRYLGRAESGDAPALDLDDEVQAGVVVTHQGRVVHPKLRSEPEAADPPKEQQVSEEGTAR